MRPTILTENVIGDIFGEHKAEIEMLVHYIRQSDGFVMANAAVAEWVLQGLQRSKSDPKAKIDPDALKKRAVSIVEGLIDIAALPISRGEDFSLTMLTERMVNALAMLIFSMSALSGKQGAFHDFMRKIGSQDLFVPLGGLLEKFKEWS